MTEDDSSHAAVKNNRGDIILPQKDIQGPNSDAPREDIAVQTALSDLPTKFLILLHLPWIGSVVIMLAAVLVYFYVHDWPSAFTEPVLGIIVGGAAAIGGSTTFNLIYKAKNAN